MLHKIMGYRIPLQSIFKYIFYVPSDTNISTVNKADELLTEMTDFQSISLSAVLHSVFSLTVVVFDIIKSKPWILHFATDRWKI
jgi:hypothetical protein